MLNALKNIDKFALRFYQNQFPYEEFVQQKEANAGITNIKDDSDNSADDDLGLDESDHEEERINKLDLDKAYEMYLSKKKEILKSYEASLEEKEENNES
jgi:hypothetical protein